MNGGGLSSLRIENCGGQAINIPAGVAATFTDLVATNCGAVVKLSATGVLDIGGSDHYVSRCEIGSSIGTVGSGTKASASLFNAAILFRGSGYFVDACVAEFADIGFYITGVGQGNHTITNCRADNHAAHGWFIDTSVVRARFTNCWSHRCGHDTDNTYNGWEVTGTACQLTNCANDGNGDTNQTKYGFRDNSSSGADNVANIYVNCYSSEHRTAAVNEATGGRRMSYLPPFRNDAQVAISGSNQTASLDQYAAVKFSAASAASISSFSNGIRNQRVMITFADANLTIVHDGTNISCPGAANITGSTTKAYEAVKLTGTLWVLYALF